jgi:hypothetical protein
VSFHIINKLVKQAAKKVNNIAKSDGVQAKFMKEADSTTKTLKQVLDFEQRFISLSIEKIAMLDAEIRLKTRKGANFPLPKYV